MSHRTKRNPATQGDNMKRSILRVASFVLAAASLAACSGGAQGGSKTHLAEVCQQRMGASSEACGCYADAIEASLPAETFSKVTSGAKLNSEYRSAEILPANVISDPAVRRAMTDAQNTCLRQA
jgi:hypothetical protein